MTKCISFGGINLPNGGVKCPNCQKEYLNKEAWQKAECRPSKTQSKVDWSKSMGPLWEGA